MPAVSETIEKHEVQFKVKYYREKTTMHFRFMLKGFHCDQYSDNTKRNVSA